MSLTPTPTRSASATPRASIDSVGGVRNGSTAKSRQVSSAARRNALREFYSIGHDKYTAGVARTEVDRPDFNVDVHLSKMVRESGIKELIMSESSLLHGMIYFELEYRELRGIP